MGRGLSQGQKVINWIERELKVPEGTHIGRDVELRTWQRKIIKGIYDKPKRRVIITFGRKNGKTSLAASSCLPISVVPYIGAIAIYSVRHKAVTKHQSYLD
jgi:phage terminase large subunit-like protein